MCVCVCVCGGGKSRRGRAGFGEQELGGGGGGKGAPHTTCTQHDRRNKMPRGIGHWNVHGPDGKVGSPSPTEGQGSRAGQPGGAAGPAHMEHTHASWQARRRARPPAPGCWRCTRRRPSGGPAAPSRGSPWDRGAAWRRAVAAPAALFFPPAGRSLGEVSSALWAWDPWSRPPEGREQVCVKIKLGLWFGAVRRIVKYSSIRAFYASWRIPGAVRVSPVSTVVRIIYTCIHT